MLDLALISEQPAIASAPARCSPPRPRTADEVVREQMQELEAADRVFVAEVVAVREIALLSGIVGREVTLLPAYGLKGRAPNREIVLRHHGFTTCGLHPMWDALRGNVGERFVLYQTDEEASQHGIVNTLAPRRLTAPAIIARLQIGDRAT